MKILITSALPYANGPLHFGHIAGAYLPGDCYARFERLLGNEVLYLCGSDEYGVAITLSAELEGRSAQEHVDHYHQVIVDLFHNLNFSFDHYFRTTSPCHKAPVRQFFTELFQNGHIEERVTEQLYSEMEKRFLADRYVIGTCPECGYEAARGDECTSCGASYDAIDLKSPRSKVTGVPLVLKKTNHWFLLLEHFRERLSNWLEQKNWKPNVVNFVKGYIKNLHARAITRDSAWGVPLPLPDTEGKVLYVWFDAPIGYISAAMEWAALKGEPEAWRSFWQDEKTKLVHFIGKDNIPFHAAIFPSMIMGQDQPFKLVDELPANEFYNLEGRQFSKSEGWYIDLDEFFTNYSADQIRYMIASTAPETADSEFTWKEFQQRCNADLVGKLGNLVNRTLVFAKSRCDGKVVDLTDLEDVDKAFLQQIDHLLEKSQTAYRSFSLRRASRAIMEIASAGNTYFDLKSPWKDAKEEASLERMRRTITCCIVCLKALALSSYPIIPKSAEKIFHMIGYSSSLTDYSWDEITSLRLPEKINEPEVLFRKVEDEEMEREMEKLKKMSETTSLHSEIKEQITFDEFQKVDLRVAKILSVEKIAKSDKLLKILINIGQETRQVVAGIGKSYDPKDLIGKKVAFVANLKPAKVMGVMSQGMILACTGCKDLEVLEIKHLPEGAVIT